MSVSATTGLVLMTLLCRFQLLRAVEGVGEIFILYNQAARLQFLCIGLAIYVSLYLTVFHAVLNTLAS